MKAITVNPYLLLTTNITFNNKKETRFDGRGFLPRRIRLSRKI